MAGGVTGITMPGGGGITANPQAPIQFSLEAAWALPAKLAFWSVCGFELLVIGMISRDIPYIWMLLLTLPHLFRLGPASALFTAKMTSVAATGATIAVMARWARSELPDAASAWGTVLAIVGSIALGGIAYASLSNKLSNSIKTGNTRGDSIEKLTEQIHESGQCLITNADHTLK